MQAIKQVKKSPYFKVPTTDVLESYLMYDADAQSVPSWISVTFA